jgi:hypothetical protein
MIRKGAAINAVSHPECKIEPCICGLHHTHRFEETISVAIYGGYRPKIRDCSGTKVITKRPAEEITLLEDAW